MSTKTRIRTVSLTRPEIAHLTNEDADRVNHKAATLTEGSPAYLLAGCTPYTSHGYLTAAQCHSGLAITFHSDHGEYVPVLDAGYVDANILTLTFQEG